MRRSRFVLPASLLILVACGSSGSSGETLAPLPTSATTTSSTAPVEVSTSAAPTSSSTSSSSTSSTFPESTDLVLRADSLGDIRFGVDPEATIDYVTAMLGEPESDTGWIDSFSEFGSCPGAEVRGVRWGDLLLLFGDESDFDSGVRHFYQWQYGPIEGDVADPIGPATDGGITLGSTVSEIDRVYDDAEVFTDVVFGPGFELEPMLWGTLSDDASTGQVLSLYGGTPCGE
jgi:hypothetical protein